MAAPPPGPTAEYELPTPPQDPISALAFNPNPAPERVGLLLVASWDKVRLILFLTLPFTPSSSVDWQCRCAADTDLASLGLEQKVRLYDTAQASSTDEVRLLHTFEHDAAVLDVCWISDTLAASGGLDRRVRL